jgi:hypothetical protein
MRSAAVVHAMAPSVLYEMVEVDLLLEHCHHLQLLE